MRKYLDITQTESNLIIRPLVEDDYPFWLKGYKEQKESMSKYDEGNFDTSFLTYEWYMKKLEERKCLAETDQCYLFNIFRMDDHASVGNCDITTHMRGDFQYARVGYTIHNQYWGLGYGTKALKALINIGFESLDFHRLEAHINLDNLASKRVAEKAGMQYECIRKGFIREDGIWMDNEIFYINNHE